MTQDRTFLMLFVPLLVPLQNRFSSNNHGLSRPYILNIQKKNNFNLLEIEALQPTNK